MKFLEPLRNGEFLVGPDNKGFFYNLENDHGCTLFLHLLSDYWAHRREETFDYDGALQGTQNFLNRSIPKVSQMRDLPVEISKQYEKIRNQLEIVLERLTGEWEMARRPLSHRQRDPNRRNKETGTSLSSHIDKLGRLWTRLRRLQWRWGEDPVYTSEKERKMEEWVCRRQRW